MNYRFAWAPHQLLARVPRRYAVDVSWTVSAQVVSMLLKMLVLVILARVLGPTQLGLFIAAKAMVGIVGSLSGWGYGELLIRNVSRDNSAAGVWWGNAIVAVLATGGILGVAITLIGTLVVPSSTIGLFITLAVTQLILVRIHVMTVNVSRARMRMARAAHLEVLPDLALIVGVLLFARFGSSVTASDWVMWQLGSIAVALVAVLIITGGTFGRPTVDVTRLLGQVSSSTHFALAKATTGLNRSADSILIARFASLEALGIFSAAYAVAGAFHMPFQALGKTLLPRFFELSGDSVRNVNEFARKTALTGVAYGCAAGVAILLFAPLVPNLLGSSYVDAVETIRWLAISPVLYAVSSTGSMTLTSLDRPQDRTRTVLVVLVLHVALALWLLPRYSWMGAVAVVLATELMLAVGFWAFIGLRTRNSKTSQTGALT